MFLFFETIFSIDSADGNQFFSLEVSTKWYLFLPTIAWGLYETQLGAGSNTSQSKSICNKNMSYFDPGPIIILDSLYLFCFFFDSNWAIAFLNSGSPCIGRYLLWWAFFLSSKITSSGTLKGDCPKPNLNISLPCNSRSLDSSLILSVDEVFKFFTISFII